jgi:hypothetical protein
MIGVQSRVLPYVTYERERIAFFTVRASPRTAGLWGRSHPTELCSYGSGDTGGAQSAGDPRICRTTTLAKTGERDRMRNTESRVPAVLAGVIERGDTPDPIGVNRASAPLRSSFVLAAFRTKSSCIPHQK